jgi:hypothetical protein
MRVRSSASRRGFDDIRIDHPFGQRSQRPARKSHSKRASWKCLERGRTADFSNHSLVARLLDQIRDEVRGILQRAVRRRMARPQAKSRTSGKNLTLSCKSDTNPRISTVTRCKIIDAWRQSWRLWGTCPSTASDDSPIAWNGSEDSARVRSHKLSHRLPKHRFFASGETP